MLRSRPDGGDQDGFSLVELLVVLTLLGLVGSVIVAGVVSATRSTAGITARNDATNALQVALQRVAREVRVGDPLEAGTAAPSTLQVRIFRNGSCSRIGYYVTGTTLMQETQTGLTPAPPALGQPMIAGACSSGLTVAPPSGGPGVTTRVVLTGIDPATPLFTYYGTNGAVLTSPVVSSAVARVGIALKLAATPARPAKLVQTSVALRNYLPPTP